MADAVELSFLRAIDDLVPRDGSVLVAVSGGGDSMALFDLLRRVAPRRGFRLTVGHLDHGLREDSSNDREFVERQAADHGIRCETERREVGELRHRSESPEEAARRVRRTFLLDTARRCGCDRIATGHNLDDQAETVLMRLVRGAGPTALTGIASEGPGPFVRPLLGIERRELREYLQRRNVPFVEDASNDDLRFDRNRVRHLAIPMLAQVLNPRAARHLVKAASRFREDALLLDDIADTAIDRIVREDPDGCWVVASRELGQLAPPIAKRVAHRVLQRAGADARRIASSHVDALLDLARGGGGRRLDLPGGLSARREPHRLVLEPGPGGSVASAKSPIYIE